MPRPANALDRVYLFGAAWMGLIIMPVYVPFLTSRGLAVGDVLTLQAALSLAVMILQVPTGYLCDVLGRKRTILAGAALNLAGLIGFATVTGLAHYLAVQMVLAAGMSLVSGADIALIYEILDSEHADRTARARALGRYVFAQTVGEAVCSLLGGALAQWSLRSVGWAAAAEAVLPLLVAACLPNPPRTQSRVRLADVPPAAWQLARQPGLRLLFANMVFWGLSTFVAVWLLQPYWQQGGVALRWFGLLWAGTLLTVAVVSRRAQALTRRIGVRGALLAITLLPVAGYAGMAVFTGAAGVLAGFLFYVSRGLNSVILVEAFNHALPARLRATLNSLGSAVSQASFALVGPLVGAAVSRAGLTGTLAGLAGACFAGFVLLAIPLLRHADLLENR